MCPWESGYLGPFTRVADLTSRRSVRSVGTNRLVVPTSILSTVGSRAFPVAGPQTWNDLLEDVTSAESLTTFRRLLKTHLFRKSLPDYLLDINWLFPVDLAVVPLLRPPKIVWFIRLIDWLRAERVYARGSWNPAERRQFVMTRFGKKQLKWYKYISSDCDTPATSL